MLVKKWCIFNPYIHILLSFRVNRENQTKMFCYIRFSIIKLFIWSSIDLIILKWINSLTLHKMLNCRSKNKAFCATVRWRAVDFQIQSTKTCSNEIYTIWKHNNTKFSKNLSFFVLDILVWIRTEVEWEICIFFTLPNF